MWLALTAMAVLIIDLFFLALSHREEAPDFFVKLSIIASQRDLISSRPPRYPVWRKDGWFVNDSRRISGNELLKLEPSLSSEHQCNITYRLADDATLRVLKRPLRQPGP